MSLHKPAITRYAVIIDPNGITTSLARDVLNEMGYNVTVERTSKLGLARIADKTMPVNLLLLHKQLGEESGFEIAERARRSRPGLPVIMWGQYVEQLDAAQAARLKIASLLGKPLTKDSIKEAAREIHERTLRALAG